MYRDTQRYDESKERYKAAITIYERLSESNPSLFIIDLLGNKLALADICSYTNDFQAAYSIMNEVIQKSHDLYFADKEEWGSTYALSMRRGAFFANMTGRFDEGEELARESIGIDSTEELVYTDLAAALLMQGKLEEAEKLYRQFKPQFKDTFLDDFTTMEQLDIIPEGRKADVMRIKQLLNE